MHHRLRAALEQQAQYKLQWAQQRKDKDEALREKDHLIKELQEKYGSVEDQVSGSRWSSSNGWRGAHVVGVLQINEAQEAAEMATLDREMAEEQLEITKQELVQLKEQVENRDIQL